MNGLNNQNKIKKKKSDYLKVQINKKKKNK